MSVYTSMYLHLFNAVTDVLSMLRSGEAVSAAACLESAQRECEELFLSASEEESELLPCAISNAGYLPPPGACLP